jgi:DNA-binding HxlR family transcriptional regulator
LECGVFTPLWKRPSANPVQKIQAASHRATIQFSRFTFKKQLILTFNLQVNNGPAIFRPMPPLKKSRSTPKTRRPDSSRRSPCPVASALDLLGDRWTLLVIRDLFLGRSRFRDFTASPESIPTNILTDRLRRLTASGLIQQIPSPDGTKHRAYQLTKKGKTLRPTLLSLRDWGLKWIGNTSTLKAEKQLT